MKIKQTLLGLVALFSASALSAQNQPSFFSQLKYRAEVGIGLSNITGHVNTDVLSATAQLQPITSPRLGIIAEYDLSDKLYLSAGLKYRQNGTKFSIQSDTEDRKWRNDRGYYETTRKSNSLKAQATLHYLSLPISLGLRHKLSPNLTAQIEGGLYLAQAFSGKGEFSHNKHSETIDIFDDNTRKDIGSSLDRNVSVNAQEIGINLSATLRFSQKYYVSIGLEQALSNLVSIKNLKDLYDGELGRIIPQGIQVKEIYSRNCTNYISIGMYF